MNLLAQTQSYDRPSGLRSCEDASTLHTAFYVSDFYSLYFVTFNLIMNIQEITLKGEFLRKT